MAKKSLLTVYFHVGNCSNKFFGKEDPNCDIGANNCQKRDSLEVLPQDCKNVRVVTKEEIKKEKGALKCRRCLKRNLQSYGTWMELPPVIDLRGAGMASSLTSTCYFSMGFP